MPLSKSDIRRDVPTRPAEIRKRIHTGDRFKTQIYHIDAPDLFLTINRDAKPEPLRDFVVIDPPVDGEIILEIYDTQESYFGVVEWLEFIQLEQSEQQYSRIPPPFANYC